MIHPGATVTVSEGERYDICLNSQDSFVIYGTLTVSPCPLVSCPKHCQCKKGVISQEYLYIFISMPIKNRRIKLPNRYFFKVTKYVNFDKIFSTVLLVLVVMHEYDKQLNLSILIGIRVFVAAEVSRLSVFYMLLFIS